jgi:hypothetical protein
LPSLNSTVSMDAARPDPGIAHHRNAGQRRPAGSRFQMISPLFSPKDLPYREESGKRTKTCYYSGTPVLGTTQEAQHPCGFPCVAAELQARGFKREREGTMDLSPSHRATTTALLRFADPAAATTLHRVVESPSEAM